MSEDIAAADTAAPAETATSAPTESAAAVNGHGGNGHDAQPLPQSWRNDLNEHWHTLNPAVQSYIIRREQEAHSQITELGGRAKQYEGRASSMSHSSSLPRSMLTLSWGLMRRKPLRRLRRRIQHS